MRFAQESRRHQAAAGHLRAVAGSRDAVGAHRDSMKLLRAAVLLLMLVWAGLAPAQAPASSAAAPACAPQLRGIWAAQEHVALVRPRAGWEAVTLPDSWNRRWPDWHGATWYRLDWQLPCSQIPLALFVSSIRTAGMVYWGESMLWRDRQLAPPYSDSSNTPRIWSVMASQPGGVQSVWIRVLGQDEPIPGLGEVRLGDAVELAHEHERRTFRQRTSYIITASLSLAIAMVALTIWLWRRQERAYLWFGLMELFCSAYLVNLLRTEPWPGMGNGGLNLLTSACAMLYTNSFLMFTQRFLERLHRRINAGVWFVTLALCAGLALAPADQSEQFLRLGLLWSAVMLSASALYAIFSAARTRRPAHIWLAVCWAVMMVVTLHDIVVALRIWNNHETWSSITGPLTTVFLAGLMGWQIAGYMRRIDGFNLELHANVTQARAELAQMLERQQQQAVENAKRQERTQMAHDLHDSIGGNLVRSMALLEQTPHLPTKRVMSMFKVLRDDLRQVIDTEAGATAPVPQTPAQWIAPLRRRLGMILDELEIQVQWQVDAFWKHPPSAIQCLTMARYMEEAFSNIIKHSRAQQVRVTCTQPSALSWQLVIEDDGVGFDVAATLAVTVGLGIGMHSMRQRLEQADGSLEIASQPGRTILTGSMRLAPAHGSELAPMPTAADSGTLPPQSAV